MSSDDRDRRIGRAVGLTEFAATLAAVLGLVLWPKVAAAAWASATWSQEQKDACALEPGCVVNAVPGGVVPVWWAIAWVAVIVAGIVVCRPPSRWWTSRGKGRFEFIADSSPKWLRAHAGVAAFLCLMLALPGRGDTTTWALEYLVPCALALGAVVLATLSARAAKRTLTPAAYRRLMGEPLLVDGASRRAARGAARVPGGSARKGEADADR